MGRSLTEARVFTLTLRRVAPLDRLLLTGALACVSGWSAVLLLLAIRRGAGAEAVVPSGLAICAGFLTYGVIAAAVYVGSQRRGWKYGKVARLTCALLAVAAAVTVQGGAEVGILRGLIGRSTAVTVVAISLVIIAGEVRSRPLPTMSGVLAGLASSVLLIVASASQPGLLVFSLSFSSLAETDADPILTNFVLPLALASPVYVLLGTAAWALFTVRVGVAVSRPLLASTAVVAGVVTVKLVWVVTAVTDVLPGWLQGRRASWEAVRTDGPWSWLLAAGLAVLLIGCLAVLDRRHHSGHPTRSRAGAARPADPGQHDRRGLWLARALYRLNTPESAMAAGLEQGEKVVRVVIWALAAPALLIAAVTVFNSAWVGAGRSLGVLPAGVLLTVALVAGRSASLGRWRVPLRVEAGLAAAVLVLTPLEPLYGGWWWLQIPIAVQQNYVFLPGVLGFVALGAAGVLVCRLWKVRQHREARVWRRTTLSLSAVALWIVVLLPIGLFYVVPLASSFPLTYPPSGSFHTHNLLPTREDMAAMSNLLGDPAPERPQRGWGGPGGVVEWVTVDAALTVGLLAFLLLTSRGPPRRSSYSNAVVLIICVTSTFVAHSATLSPVSWGRGGWLYCAMVFPAAYEILFNSRQASRLPGSLFALVVATATAVTTLGVLAVTSRTFLSDAYPLDSTIFGYARHFGAQFYVYPIAMTYLLLALIHWRRTRPATATPAPAREPNPTPAHRSA
jgi:hypothetical protein